MSEDADLSEIASEDEKVKRWRLQQLEDDMGFPPYLAFLLAQDNDVDLHRAASLLLKGCSHETAFRILT